VAGSQVPNHIFVYSLDTNIQFILNCAPIICRTCNAILNWTNKVKLNFDRQFDNDADLKNLRKKKYIYNNNNFLMPTNFNFEKINFLF